MRLSPVAKRRLPWHPPQGERLGHACPRLHRAQGSRQEHGTPWAQQRPGVQRPQSRRSAEGRAARLGSQRLRLGATFGPQPPEGRKQAGGGSHRRFVLRSLLTSRLTRTVASSVLHCASWGDPCKRLCTPTLWPLWVPCSAPPPPMHFSQEETGEESWRPGSWMESRFGRMARAMRAAPRDPGDPRDPERSWHPRPLGLVKSSPQRFSAPT